jgi:hypothetical protein
MCRASSRKRWTVLFIEARAFNVRSMSQSVGARHRVSFLPHKRVYVCVHAAATPGRGFGYITSMVIVLPHSHMLCRGSFLCAACTRRAFLSQESIRSLFRGFAAAPGSPLAMQGGLATVLSSEHGRCPNAGHCLVYVPDAHRRGLALWYSAYNVDRSL